MLAKLVPYPANKLSVAHVPEKPNEKDLKMSDLLRRRSSIQEFLFLDELVNCCLNSDNNCQYFLIQR